MTLKSTLLALAAGITLFTTQLSADFALRTTILTFSAPVEVPGKVLPAGKYTFQRLDSGKNRHIIRVYSEDSLAPVAVFNTYANFNRKTVNKAVVGIKERANGAPAQLTSLLYPGDRYGLTFLYPETPAN